MNKPFKVQLREFIKHVVQWGNDRLLSVVGVRLVNINRPTRNYVDFFTHLKRLKFEAKTVIDIGVAWGTDDIYEAFPKAKYYLVEPMEEFRASMEQLKKKYDVEYVVAAAGSAPGELTLNIHEDPRRTSALERSFVERRIVPTITLDGLLAQRDIAFPLMLKIDAEGQELTVLEGASIVLSKADLVILETRLFSYVPGLPVIAEIMNYMSLRGFILYDILDGGYRPLDGALELVDLAFVPSSSELRKDMRFSRSDPDAKAW